MLNLKKIAITGTVASGKTTVCRIFEEYGAYVVNTDKVVEELLSLNTSIRAEVIRLLGPEIVVNDKLDKKKISQIVFSNPTKLKLLEEIIHPAVKQNLNYQFDMASKQLKYKFFIAEVPLLFETEMQNQFDYIIVVKTKLENARSRFQGTYFEERLNRQLSSNNQARKADFIIHNNQDIENLKAEIKKIIYQLQTDSKEHK